MPSVLQDQKGDVANRHHLEIHSTPKVLSEPLNTEPLPQALEFEVWSFSGAWMLVLGASFKKSSKLQAPTSREIPKFNIQTNSHGAFWCLDLEASLELGCWCLELHYLANASDCFTNSSPVHSPSACTIFFCGAAAAAFCAALRSDWRFTRSACVVK